MRYPRLISALFSVCTPFGAPRTQYIPATVLPNFKYQLQLAGPDVEAHVVGGEKLRQFLNGLYGGKTPNGEPTFDVSHGFHLDKLSEIGQSPLVTKEEMDFYVERYTIHGMHGPLNVSKLLGVPLGNGMLISLSSGIELAS